MEPKEKTSIGSKDLLQNPIQTPIQAFSTPTKYPCTCFCYIAAINKQHIIDLYHQHKSGSQQYFNYIYHLINIAGQRKKNNPKIHPRGEYINCETTKLDFPQIYNKMTFLELSSPDQESFIITQNTLYILLTETDIGGYMMITRSDETFLLLKLDPETFFLVDSHQPNHGLINIEKATQYILKSGTYKGLTQIGYTRQNLNN